MAQEQRNTKYMALYSDLKEAIEQGNYLMGALLPTEKQMMSQYNISRNTVRRAVAMLEMDGLVSVSSGRGTQVLKGRTNRDHPSFKSPPYEVTYIEKKGGDPAEDGYSSATIDTMQADTSVAKKLKVESLTEVYRIQRLKFCGKKPSSYVISYLAKDKLPGLERFSGHIIWLNKLIHDYYHLDPVAAHEIVTARTASFLEANLLQLKVGSPVMVVQRVAEYEQDVVEFTETCYNPDYFYISIEMKGRPDYLITTDPAVI